MSNPVRVTVTGAAGQIGYSIVFRIASGQLLGPEQPVDLRLLEIPQAMGALEGVAMELDRLRLSAARGARPARQPRRTPSTASNIALLVGSRPRTKGMERAELLSENGKIFTVQGKALNERAAEDMKVLVVGNPANTNCLIAMNNAPRHPARALHLDDAPRPQPRDRAAGGEARGAVTDVPRWASGATTRRRCTPTCSTPRCAASWPPDVVDDQAWIEQEFLPNVGKRGAAIIEARGASSAASAASAAIDHVRDWVSGTRRRMGLDGRRLRRLLRRSRGPDLRLSVHLRRTASTRSSRASSWTSSRAPRWTPRWPS